MGALPFAFPALRNSQPDTPPIGMGLVTRPAALREAGVATLLLAILTLSTLLPLTARAEEKLPYLGKWSDGRGETLVITTKTLRFGRNPALTYRDITRVTDGNTFELQITNSRPKAAVGNYLALYCEEDHVRIVGYSSQADLVHDENIASDVTWYKDDAQD